MTKLERAERILRKEIEAGLEEGWTLIKGRLRGAVCDKNYNTLADDACGCALGMAVRDVPITIEPYGVDEAPLYKILGEKLDLTSTEVTSIWMGFDGTNASDHYDKNFDPLADFKALGARLREDYYDTTEEMA